MGNGGRLSREGQRGIQRGHQIISLQVPAVRTGAGKVEAGGLPVLRRDLRRTASRNGNLRFQIQYPIHRQHLVHQLIQPSAVITVHRFIRQQAVLLQRPLRQQAISFRVQNLRRLAEPAVIARIFFHCVKDLPAQGQQHLMKRSRTPGNGTGNTVDLLAGIAAAVPIAL